MWSRATARSCATATRENRPLRSRHCATTTSTAPRSRLSFSALRHDEVPAILQRGERVLSRREAQTYGASGGVNVTIMARDAESFRQSRTQVAADIARAVSLGRRGM